MLAAVFGASGLGKLGDRAGSRQAMIDFGAPPRAAAPLAALLPLVELATAAALLFAGAAWWGALSALLLLLVFTGAIAVNLALGRRPDCHCFGQIHSEPAGWPMVARNLVLVAVAASVLVRGRAGAGPSAVDWLGRLTPFELAVTLTGGAALPLLAGILWTLRQLMRQQGRLMASIEELQSKMGSGKLDATGEERAAAVGLEVGTPAPTFTVHDKHGNAVTLDGLRAPGKPVLLTFIQPGCNACKTLAPHLGRWQWELATDLTVAVISRGSAKAPCSSVRTARSAVASRRAKRRSASSSSR